MSVSSRYILLHENKLEQSIVLALLKRISLTTTTVEDTGIDVKFKKCYSASLKKAPERIYFVLVINQDK